MPSKANARRRAARGIGHNGIPQEPTNRTTNKTTAATSAAPWASQPTSASSMSTSNTPGPDMAESSTATRTITQVHGDAIVQMYFQTRPFDANGDAYDDYIDIGTVEAAKMLGMSGRIEREFASQDLDLSSATTAHFTINCEGTTLETCKEFLKWVNGSRRVTLSYQGIRQIAFNSSWSAAELASLLALTRWLELKAPNSSRALENKVWGCFKDETKPIDAAAVLSIWLIESHLDDNLKRHTLWRAAHAVRVADKTNDDGEAKHLAFLATFAPCQALKDAYRAKVHESRRKAEQKVQRQEKFLAAKADKEWKEQKAAAKKQDDASRRELLDRRGVSTISWEEARARRG